MAILSTVRGSGPAPDLKTKIPPRWLVPAWVAWLALAALDIALLLIGTPVEYGYYLASGNSEFAAGLRQLGASAEFYATYRTGLDVAAAAAFVFVGVAVVWRRRDDWMVMLVSLASITFASLYVPIVARLAEAQPELSGTVGLVRALGLLLALLVFYLLLPDGRFVPRWTRWLAVGWMVLVLIWLLRPDAPENLVYLSTWMKNPPLGLGLYVVFFGAGVFAQAYRYRNVSSSTQRQQTKWVVYGTTAAVIGFVIYYGPLILAPSVYRPGVARLLHVFLLLPVFEGLVVAAPVAIAASVLRYRLWQVDLIINRTLVYGTLTVTLVLLYFFSIVLLQPLFENLVGKGLDVAVAVSTLGIAATFNPFRKHLQRLIDRVFYKGKFETAQTLAAFTATARQEVDLDRLSEQLLSVVERALGPAQTTLWIREPSFADRRLDGAPEAATGGVLPVAGGSQAGSRPSPRGGEDFAAMTGPTGERSAALGQFARRSFGALWFAISLITAGLFVLALPLQQAELLARVRALTPGELLALRGSGLDPFQQVGAVTVEEALVPAIFFALALVIYWRRNDDYVAVLSAIALVTYIAWAAPPLDALATARPDLRALSSVVQAIGMNFTVTFLYVFPDGRLVPRWSWLLFPLWVGWGVLWVALPGTGFDLSNPFPIPLPAFLAEMALWLAGLGAQLYRYARVATPTERQQMKMVLLAATLGISGYVALCLVRYVVPFFSQSRVGSLLYDLTLVPAFLVLVLVIPAGYAASILRYRLWDIDLVIRRTLVYAAVTATLAVVYYGSVVALQEALRAFTEQGSALAIAASTWAIALLFSPVRRRMQTLIDARFYRRRYDREKVLAAFGGVVKEEVNLESLTRQLLTTVEDTIQPSYASLWLRDSPRPLHSTSTSRRNRADGD